MDELGNVVEASLTLFGRVITFNPVTFVITWVVMIALIVLGYFGAKTLKKVPGKLQGVFELIHDFLKV